MLGRFKQKTAELIHNVGQFQVSDVSILEAEEQMFVFSKERLWQQPYRQITTGKRPMKDDSRHLLRKSWRESLESGTISGQLALKVLNKQMTNYFERLVKVKVLRDKRHRMKMGNATEKDYDLTEDDLNGDKSHLDEKLD